MHFLLYLPGKSGANPQHLIDVGLPDLVDNAQFVDVAERSAPDGNAGLLVFWPKSGERKPRYEFAPDEQTWLPGLGTSEPRYQIGYWTDAPPTPTDLQRPTIFNGTAIAMGDGNHWTIPAAARLPKNCTLDAEGTPQFTIKREFQSFWEESAVWYMKLVHDVNADGDILVSPTWWPYVVKALRLNYRIVPELVSALELLDVDNMIETVLATIDGHAIAQAAADQKKTPDAPTPES